MPIFRVKQVNLALAIAFLLTIIVTRQTGWAAQSSLQNPCEGFRTQLEMATCQEQQAKEADQALNTLYAAVMKKLNSKERVQLKAAQKAWIAYREADCEAQTALYKGGSIAPLIKAACLTKATQDRTKDIKRIYGQKLDK